MLIQTTKYEDGGCDLLIIGTGYFSEIMLLDIAATAKAPLRIVVGGRNVSRMQWLVDAGRSRSTIYATDVQYSYVEIDFASAEAIAPVIARLQPRVVVQSASVQSPWKVDIAASDWSHLVAAAGFGITISFHALLAWRTSAALRLENSNAYFVNTCYPDGVNQVLKAADMPLTTGVGNAGIFSAMIGGRLPVKQRGDLRVLAHHQHLVQWRKPGVERSGSPVRAWVGELEIQNVDDLTRDVQLPYRDLNAVSGASATPVLLGLLGLWKGRAHVPGPDGLPGGYPVQVDENGVTLDLPVGISLQDAIAWNRQFEAADGVSITESGHIVYSDKARKILGKVAPDLAEGFHVNDIEQAAAALGSLRSSMGG